VGVDWQKVLYTPKDLKAGIKVELEHGRCLEGKPSKLNVTNDNLKKTTKIALAHLTEDFRYYTALEKMETSLKHTKRSATTKKQKQKLNKKLK
jgi:hypothetical protein